MKTTMTHARNVLSALLGLSALAACSIVPPTSVHQPMSARPVAAREAGAVAATGAIYQAGGAKMSLFEDLRARNVGDILTVLIEEKATAAKKSNSAASRAGSDSFSVPTVFGLPGKSFQEANLAASSANKFDAKGESASNNTFTGNVTVTVIEVLANGNLLVSGEKQVSISQGTEYIRFSGVVNPVTLNAANTVSSTKVADARIEYKGSGYIDEAQTMGWLARFFQSVSPF
jgi:flagellar L-ring protein precursor FlgH